MRQSPQRVRNPADYGYPSTDNAHTLLQALLPNDARTIYNFHQGLLRLGQRICVYERPRCNQCQLTELCDYYKTVVNPLI